MLILLQERRSLEVTENTFGVYVDGNEINIDLGETSRLTIGVYQNEERAMEVLKMIFNRYERGQRVFEMPEE